MEQKPALLSNKAAAAILAVEGLSLSPAYKTRIEALQSKSFTADQIREAIIADFDKRDAA
jgi:hypothetical protein